MEVLNCPSCNCFNVFGLPDKPCCYKYHKYCNEVDSCIIKTLLCLSSDYLTSSELSVLLGVSE